MKGHQESGKKTSPKSRLKEVSSPSLVLTVVSKELL